MMRLMSLTANFESFSGGEPKGFVGFAPFSGFLKARKSSSEGVLVFLLVMANTLVIAAILTLMVWGW